MSMASPTDDTWRPTYTAECALLRRLLYKNWNQHRGTPYMVRVREVCARLRGLDRGGAVDVVGALLADPARRGSGSGVGSSASLEPRRLLHGDIRGCHQCIVRCWVAVRTLLGQGYFMPFALVVMAALSRLAALVSVAADALAAGDEGFLPLSSELVQGTGSTGVEFGGAAGLWVDGGVRRWWK